MWNKLIKFGANGWPFNTHLFVTTLFMILDLAIKKLLIDKLGPLEDALFKER